MSNFKKALLTLGTVMGLASCLGGLAACGEELKEHSHTYSWQEVKAATCTEEGERKGTCTVEGCTSEKTEPIAALGHDYVREENPKAKCEVEGTLHITCSRCDYNETEATAALEHAYRPTGEYTAATCTTPSVTEQKCALCGDVIEVEGNDAPGHKISNAVIIKEANCTEQGERTGECSVCHTVFTRENPDKTPALGHTLSSLNKSVEKDATCTETGIMSGTCTVCGQPATEVIPLTDHVWDPEFTLDKAPTYTTKGSKSIHCRNCTLKKDEREISVLQEGTAIEYEFRLVNRGGAVLESNCTVAIVDAENNSTSASFKKGKCTVSLVPGEYKVNLIGLPKGYKTETYTVRAGDVISDFLVGISVLEGTAPANMVYGIGSVMYDFTVNDTDGNTYKLSELVKQYRLIMVNFWATWCPPCESEFPAMNAAYLDYKDDVFVIAVSSGTGDNESLVRQYKESHGIAFPMTSYGGGNGLRNHFSFSGIPTTVLISPEGIVLFQHTSALMMKEQFTMLFDEYMADAPAAASFSPQGERILADTEYMTGKELEV